MKQVAIAYSNRFSEVEMVNCIETYHCNYLYYLRELLFVFFIFK